MPNSPRLIIAFADSAARWIRSPTPWPTSQARQKWTANCWRGDYPKIQFFFIHAQYYVNDDLPDVIQNPKVSPLAHRPPPYDSWGVKGRQELAANPPSHSHDSWAHIQQLQLVTALGSSQNGLSGAGTSQQKEPSRLRISSCSITPWDPCSALRHSKHRSWELTTVIRLRHVKQSHPWTSCHRRQWSLRQWNRSENLQVQAVLFCWSQWSWNVI